MPRFVSRWLFAIGIAGAAHAENSVRFDASVPVEQSRQLQLDLGLLKRLAFSTSDDELLTQMGLGDLSSRSLENWLAERVRVVVGESIETSLPSSNARWGAPPLIPNQRRPRVLMTNLGLDLYLRGKKRAVEAALKTQSLGVIPVRSPRAGIVQLSSALFASEMRLLGPTSKLDAVGNSLSRLLVFFHEARHSDGHDASLGFQHVRCPSGHWLEGHLACDRAPNGAYAIEARLTFAFARSCPDCTLVDKERLRASATDALARVLDDSNPDAGVDPDELVALDREIELLRKLGNAPAKLAELEARRRSLEASGEGSIDWDPAPEGIF